MKTISNFPGLSSFAAACALAALPQNHPLVKKAHDLRDNHGTIGDIVGLIEGALSPRKHNDDKSKPRQSGMYLFSENHLALMSSHSTLNGLSQLMVDHIVGDALDLSPSKKDLKKTTEPILFEILGKASLPQEIQWIRNAFDKKSPTALTSLILKPEFEYKVGNFLENPIDRKLSNHLVHDVLTNLPKDPVAATRTLRIIEDFISDASHPHYQEYLPLVRKGLEGAKKSAGGPLSDEQVDRVINGEPPKNIEAQAVAVTTTEESGDVRAKRVLGSGIFPRVDAVMGLRTSITDQCKHLRTIEDLAPLIALLKELREKNGTLDSPLTKTILESSIEMASLQKVLYHRAMNELLTLVMQLNNESIEIWYELTGSPSARVVTFNGNFKGLLRAITWCLKRATQTDEEKNEKAIDIWERLQKHRGSDAEGAPLGSATYQNSPVHWWDLQLGLIANDLWEEVKRVKRDHTAAWLDFYTSHQESSDTLEEFIKRFPEPN